MKSQREQHADIVSLHREFYGEQIRDTDVTRGDHAVCVGQPDVHRENEQQNAYAYANPGGEQVEKLLSEPEQHHADAEEMQDTEHDGSACEERHDEGHYHADEEALRAAFDVVGGIAADRTGNKYEQSRKDIPYHIEPAVEENRNIQTEQVFQVVHGVVDHHADYGKSAELVEDTDPRRAGTFLCIIHLCISPF